MASFSCVASFFAAHGYDFDGLWLYCEFVGVAVDEVVVADEPMAIPFDGVH
jgi:hypothetical protein